MTPLGFEFNSEDPNLSVCPKPSYWTQTFLSTAGTAVPIFLQPCGLSQHKYQKRHIIIPKLNGYSQEGVKRTSGQHNDTKNDDDSKSEEEPKCEE